jgi:Mn2+/Fe2+ NRAMP family transporter
MAQNDRDPYKSSEEDVQEPPVGFLASIRFLGPGLILSASVVGSGELIATTVLGAKGGFVTLWVILISCLVKVALQLEFGKHAISSGEPTMVALDKLPGPRFKVSWAIWVWLGIYVLKYVQEGGVLGGVTLALQAAFPHFLKDGWWALIVAVAVSLLVFRGHYVFIQAAAVVMTGLFTLLTLFCVIILQFTPYAFSFSDVASGLTFHLPAAAVAVALGAFGITGIGGDEIMHYVYWCIEKGYARYTGPFRDGADWTRRAKGWIRVMYRDALVSMVVYTVVTAAFYLLGAAVLHKLGEVPKEKETIEVLSRMYTETLGGWAKGIFLTGAFIVLFSTLFAALAAWARQFADAFGRLGLLDFFNRQHRHRFIAVFAWVSPLIWCALFLSLKKKVVAMIVLGGIATFVMLLLVAYAAIHFRYKRLPTPLKPSRAYDLWLWLSIAAIIAVGVYSVYQAIPR